MMRLQDKSKLNRLMQEGYELDAIIVYPEWDDRQPRVVYLIIDYSQIHYMADQLNQLKKYTDNMQRYYEDVIKIIESEGEEYTPSTNDMDILKRTWDYGFAACDYLPWAIESAWRETNIERQQ